MDDHQDGRSMIQPRNGAFEVAPFGMAKPIPRDEHRCHPRGEGVSSLWVLVFSSSIPSAEAPS